MWSPKKCKNFHCEGNLNCAEVFLSCCFWHEICSIRWWQSWVIGWCKQAQKFKPTKQFLVQSKCLHSNHQKSNMRLQQQPAYRHIITTTKWWYEQSTEPPFSGLNKGSGAIAHIKSHKVFLGQTLKQFNKRTVLKFIWLQRIKNQTKNHTYFHNLSLQSYV